MFRLPGRFLLDGAGAHPQPGRRASTARTGSRSSMVREHRDRRRRDVDCDTVVFTGDWIPDHELARTGGLAMDPATRGPVVDAGLRTSRPGVFAVGNLLHPVDTADGAALGRPPRRAAREQVGWSGRDEPHPKAVRIRADGPLQMGCTAAGLSRRRRGGQRRSAVLGRRVPSAAEAAGRAGRQDARRRNARRGPPRRAGCTGRRGRWWRTPTRQAATITVSFA